MLHPSHPLYFPLSDQPFHDTQHSIANNQFYMAKETGWRLLELSFAMITSITSCIFSVCIILQPGCTKSLMRIGSSEAIVMVTRIHGSQSTKRPLQICSSNSFYSAQPLWYVTFSTSRIQRSTSPAMHHERNNEYGFDEQRLSLSGLTSSSRSAIYVFIITTPRCLSITNTYTGQLRVAAMSTLSPSRPPQLIFQS